MKRPYITVKFAQTLDGKIAARDGSSRWISGPRARKFAHTLRAKNHAVIVGIRTVLRDDPSLTVRLTKGKNPARIILDSRLRIPVEARVVREANLAKTIIITTGKAPTGKVKRLEAAGVEVIILPASKGGHVDLHRIIRILYRRGLKKVLVEGGSRVITSFLKAGLADKIVTIISPRILGSGVESVGDLGIQNMNNAVGLRIKNVRRLGRDVVYTTAGFTIFEIMMVVLIIGFLALIAIPNYIEIRDRARRELCMANQKAIFVAATGYVLNEANSLATMSHDERLDALEASGYLKGEEWQSCPSAGSKNAKDYTLVFDGDVVVDVECDVKGDQHQWPQDEF